MKRLLAILITCGLALHIAGCSSGEQSGDGEGDANTAAAEENLDESAPAADGATDQAATDDVSGDVKDDASLDKDPGTDQVAAGDATDDFDKPSDDPLADAGKTDDQTTDQPATDQAAMDQQQPTDQQQAEAQPAPSPEAPPADAAPAPAPEPQIADAAPFEPAPAPKPMAPLQKIKDVPFSKRGTLLNTVYIARPGDTLKDVAGKTLGDESKGRELVKYNPVLNRGVKTGDKIYYNSPNHPDNSEKMMTYYEDKNIPPQIYTSAPGDTMKSVAQNLLGSKDTWKELWATNDVQEKGALPEGTQLRYWPGDEAAPPMPIAKTEPPKQELPPPPPPAPSPGLANATPPPSPEAMPNAMGQASTTPQPPPQMPPPAPPRPAKVKPPQDEGLFGLGGDSMIYMIGGGAALIGIGLMLAIKKKKDASRFATEGQTQI